MALAKHEIQEFNHIRFYLLPTGYYMADAIKHGKCLYMHRHVWEFYNGNIPNGYNIHHLDEDKRNNRINNLKLIEHSEHVGLHSREWHANNPEKSKEMMNSLRAKAREWSKTDEGISAQKQSGIDSWKNQHKTILICTWCDKEYEGYANRVKTGACSKSCYHKYYRAKKKQQN